MLIGTEELTPGNGYNKGKLKDPECEGQVMNPLLLKATEETNSVYTLT